MATKLHELVNAHAERISPRLVGAFVYDTDTEFSPTAAQRQSLLWCPQELPSELLPTADPSFYDFNCTNLPADQLDLRVINFVAPLGPFPSLENYGRYVDRFGDKGLAGNPTLVFRAVPTSPTTRQERGQRVTFFDNERMTLGAGEAMRACPFREPNPLGYLRFRTPDMPASLQSLGVEEVDQLWRAGEAVGDYAVGIAWDLPYFGAIEYTSTVTGKVVSAIPFQRSGRSSQSLGDPVWTLQRWDIGAFLEHCRKYCDHPVFDSQGVYQIRLPWREQPPDSCPPARFPLYREGT